MSEGRKNQLNHLVNEADISRLLSICKHEYSIQSVKTFQVMPRSAKPTALPPISPSKPAHYRKRKALLLSKDKYPKTLQP